MDFHGADAGVYGCEFGELLGYVCENCVGVVEEVQKEEAGESDDSEEDCVGEEEVEKGG